MLGSALGDFGSLDGRENIDDDESRGRATQYTCENSPVPTSSTFANRDVRLGSTSGASNPFNGRLGRFPACRKESRGPVGVAGRLDALKFVLIDCWSLTAEIDKPLGSGGKR